MTLKQKILACHGFLTGKSTAIVCGCSTGYVYETWRCYERKPIRKNSHRSTPVW